MKVTLKSVLSKIILAYSNGNVSKCTGKPIKKHNRKAYARGLEDLRGGSRGRVQEVRTPPFPEMTCGFLIQLVFCKKKTMWFIGVEVEQETSAPPPKNNPGSAPRPYKIITSLIIPRIFTLKLTRQFLCRTVCFLQTLDLVFCITTPLLKI